MKRSVATITASIYLGMASPLANGEAVHGVSPEAKPTAVDNLHDSIKRDILPRLGGVGLILISQEQDKKVGHIVLLVATPDSADCGSEFSFTPGDDFGVPVTRVGFTLYGNLADLTDKTKLEGHEMWDGTIGHGDNVAPFPLVYSPGDPTAAERALEYMRQNTSLACNEFLSGQPNLG